MKWSSKSSLAAELRGLVEACSARVLRPPRVRTCKADAWYILTSLRGLVLKVDVYR